MWSILLGKGKGVNAGLSHVNPWPVICALHRDTDMLRRPQCYDLLPT